MEYIDTDTNSVIFSFLPITDQAKLHGMFGQKAPSQYKISREMLIKKTNGNLQGFNGLFRRATTTGDLEPCVQLMNQISLPGTENYTWQDFSSYDPGQRVDRIMNIVSVSGDLIQ